MQLDLSGNLTCNLGPNQLGLGQEGVRRLPRGLACPAPQRKTCAGPRAWPGTAEAGPFEAAPVPCDPLTLPGASLCCLPSSPDQSCSAAASEVAAPRTLS